MVHLTINGRIVQAEEGEMLLAVIRREGIKIPAECHHEAVEPFGACRLCTVEITRKEWDGWSNYVTSCLYPVADGLIVEVHPDPENAKSDQKQQMNFQEFEKFMKEISDFCNAIGKKII